MTDQCAHDDCLTQDEVNDIVKKRLARQKIAVHKTDLDHIMHTLDVIQAQLDDIQKQL